MIRFNIFNLPFFDSLPHYFIFYFNAIKSCDRGAKCDSENRPLVARQRGLRHRGRFSLSYCCVVVTGRERWGLLLGGKREVTKKKENTVIKIIIISIRIRKCCVPFDKKIFLPGYALFSIIRGYGFFIIKKKALLQASF